MEKRNGRDWTGEKLVMSMIEEWKCQGRKWLRYDGDVVGRWEWELFYI